MERFCDLCKECFDPRRSGETFISLSNPIVYCGNECDLKPYPHPRSRWNSKFGKYSQVLFPGIEPDDHIDFCPECSKKFLKFIENADADPKDDYGWDNDRFEKLVQSVQKRLEKNRP